MTMCIAQGSFIMAHQDSPGDSFSRAPSVGTSFNKVPVDIYRLESACATHAKETKEDVVPVLVEVPRGTPNKYELEKDWGLLALDRVLHSSVFYPGDYGFVPNTLCGDGDPIDVLILSNYALTPGLDCHRLVLLIEQAIPSSTAETLVLQSRLRRSNKGGFKTPCFRFGIISSPKPSIPWIRRKTKKCTNTP